MENSLKIHLLCFSKSFWRSLPQTFLEASMLYNVFTSFDSGWGAQYFKQKPTSQLPNRSVKYLLFYTKDLTYLLHFQRKLALFIAKILGNIHFLPLFYFFWEWVRCLILQTNTNFLVSHQKNLYFHPRDFTCLLNFQKHKVVSIRGVFRTQLNI